MASEIAVGTALTLLLTLAAGAGKVLHGQLTARIDDVEGRVDGLEDDHAETRRVAESAYAGVYGDDMRPDDEGVLVAGQQAREEIHSELGEIREQVEQLRRELEQLRVGDVGGAGEDRGRDNDRLDRYEDD